MVVVLRPFHVGEIYLSLIIYKMTKTGLGIVTYLVLFVKTRFGGIKMSAKQRKES